MAKNMNSVGHGDADENHRQGVGDNKEGHITGGHNAQGHQHRGGDNHIGIECRQEATEGQHNNQGDHDAGNGVKPLGITVDIGPEVTRDRAFTGHM